VKNFKSNDYINIPTTEGERMRTGILVLLVAIVVLITAAIAGGISNGPPDGRTGAPGETDCTVNCHNSYSVNSGDGSLSIDDVPTEYNPEETYSLSVTIQDPGQQRWGFELTVLDSANNKAGNLTITDSTNTQLSTNGPRDYIKQTSAGTFDGTSDGPVSWDFDWTAPSSDTGTVTFYTAGNAANSGSGNLFDYIYTTTISSDEAGGGTTNQPPTCTISSPSSGTKLSGSASISGTASETDGTVQNVEVKVDSDSWNQATGTESWSYNLDTTGLSNGAHTVYARAYDGESYSSEVSVNIEVDNEGGGNGDSEDGDSLLMILIAVIVIIVLVIIVAVLMRGRK
jgi:hypothetical protein